MTIWEDHGEYSNLARNAESRGEREDTLREAVGIYRLAIFSATCFALAAAVWKWLR